MLVGLIIFFQELENNTSSLLSQRFSCIASAIPFDFPDVSVLNLYINLLISNGPIPSFSWIAPDIQHLALLAEDHFVWGHLPGILNHFTDTVFSSFAL